MKEHKQDEGHLKAHGAVNIKMSERLGYQGDGSVLEVRCKMMFPACAGANYILYCQRWDGVCI